MQLDGAALDQGRFEGLDAEPVQGRRAVKHDRPFLDYLGQNIPDFRPGTLNLAAGALNIMRITLFDEPSHHKGFKKLQRHMLGQAALVQLELRTDHDHRTAAVVNAFAQQVLAEAALLTAQHVGKGLELVRAGGAGQPAPPAVIDESINSFLQHPFFIADDDLGGSQLHELFQTIITIDHPAVEVIQIAGGETSAVQLDNRS